MNMKDKVIFLVLVIVFLLITVLSVQVEGEQINASMTEQSK